MSPDNITTSGPIASFANIHPSALAYYNGPRYRQWLVDLANAYDLEADTDNLILVALNAKAIDIGFDESLPSPIERVWYVHLNQRFDEFAAEAWALDLWLTRLRTAAGLNTHETVEAGLACLASAINFPPFDPNDLEEPASAAEAPAA